MENYAKIVASDVNNLMKVGQKEKAMKMVDNFCDDEMENLDALAEFSAYLNDDVREELGC